MSGKKTKSINKKNIAISCISLFISTMYPILFMYFRNIYEARERHLIPITAIYIAFAFIMCIVDFLFIKNFHKSAIITTIILVIVFNYEFAVSLFSSNKTIGYIVITLLSIILLCIAIVISKKISEDSAVKLNGIWCFTLIVLLLMNFVPVAPYMLKKVISHIPSAGIVKEVNYNASSSSEPAESKYDNMDDPNVYLMIFDEYGGSENLKHYYDYDNSDFLSKLADKRFNISENSYNRESISTITNVPNLFNMEYVVDHETEAETFLTYLMNPYLYTFFKERGYDINTASYPAFLDNTQSTLNYDTKELYEDTVGYYILKNSLFIHIYDILIAPNMNGTEFASSSNTGMYLIQSMDCYKGFVNASSDKPHLNLGYFSCPHVPLCYKSDGTPLTEDEIENDFSYSYIEYLKWTSNQIDDIVDTILESDPNSIIIIMSDHGSRSLNMESDSSLDDPDYYKENILNCVYFKGEVLDISGLSGINTLIHILNNEYGCDMPFKYYNK